MKNAFQIDCRHFRPPPEVVKKNWIFQFFKIEMFIKRIIDILSNNMSTGCWYFQTGSSAEIRRFFYWNFVKREIWLILFFQKIYCLIVVFFSFINDRRWILQIFRQNTCRWQQLDMKYIFQIYGIQHEFHVFYT